ncbi:MAG: hypothetical protein QUS14_00810 [Pyrinomonadaceae bacterium]|nr:hypothetical protein [Pyrinomonadaceae bacterium]
MLPMFGLAQGSGTASFAYRTDSDIVVKIDQGIQNTEQNPPLVRIYESVSSGGQIRSRLRDSLQTVAFSRMPSPLGLEIGIRLPKPSAGFRKFEIDVSNYLSEGDNLNFRIVVPIGVSAELGAATRDTVKVKFSIPGNVAGGCSRSKEWILRAFSREGGTRLTGTRSSGKAVEYSVLSASDGNVLGEGVADICTFETELRLDQRMPAAETLSPAQILFDPAFFDSDFTAVSHPAFASLRDGIKGAITTPAAINEAEKRDEVRQGVFEMGGGLTTTKQKENVTNENEDRETSGFIDLRIALPTRYYFGRGRGPSVSSWWSWTPAQLDAMISEGKLTVKNISTNTMRLFTQAQFTQDVSGRLPSGSRKGTDFIVMNFEGGAAADRDLRVIEYTVGSDFRLEPGFLNRTFGKSETGKTPTLLFEVSPAGFEIGGRQVRRDPLFPDTDTFVRRYRFATRIELQLPPYVQFTLENRSWIRGEVSDDRFRNYFKTSLNLFPRKLNENVSAGVFLSYEVGSSPPFSTPAIATFKLGFRVRAKRW